MKNAIKGILAVFIVIVSSMFLGWLMRYVVIGLLCVPMWATFIILILLGRLFYAIVDAIGALSNIPAVKLCMFNSRLWLWLCVFGIAITSVVNCILFWCADIHYEMIEIVISFIIMMLYIARSIKTCMCFIEIPIYEKENV